MRLNRRERRKQRLPHTEIAALNSRVEGASFQATRTQESNVVKSSKSVGFPRTGMSLAQGMNCP